MLILLAVQWLTRTAYELLACAGRGGRGDVLGADDVFPLLVNVLAHSNIPCIHLIMVRIVSTALLCSFLSNTLVCFMNAVMMVHLEDALSNAGILLRYHFFVVYNSIICTRTQSWNLLAKLVRKSLYSAFNHHRLHHQHHFSRVWVSLPTNYL